MLQSGDRAPAFSLPATGGGALTVESFTNRNLVLYFYPKDDTSGCTRQAREFSALRDAFLACGTDILGVSPDPLAAHDRFRAKYDLALPLASDEDKRTLEAYGVWVEKSMYGRRYMGVERTTFLIDGNARIVRIWPKVKVPGHAEEVLAAARAL